MRTLIFFAVVLAIFGGWAGKQYAFLFMSQGSREAYPEYQQVQEMFAEEKAESKYPVKARPYVPAIKGSGVDAFGKGIRTRSNFVAPKSRSGRRPSNPFVGN